MQRILERRAIAGWLGAVGPAAALAAAGAFEVWANSRIEPKAVAYPCEISLGLALAWRRRFPLGTLGLVVLLGTIEVLAGVPVNEPWVPLAVYIVATYCLASSADRERVVAGIALVAVAIAVQVLDQHKGLANFAFAMVFLTPIYFAGRAIRSRSEHVEELERQQDVRARAAAEQERRRIARELHDVISHSLGVLVLQAGAAEQVLERDPDKAREVLREIRTGGHEAIRELGTLLALAHGEIESSREPQPSLADLPDLTEKIRRAGLRVELVVEGAPRTLPAAVELSAYRIVQEGLTNVVKHTRDASASVLVRYSDRELAIEVVDNGAGAGSGTGSRRGLAGISERVSVFGGRFRAGPGPDGGWVVAAVLPVPA